MSFEIYIYDQMLLLKIAVLFLCIIDCISRKYNNYTLFRGTPDSEHKKAFFERIVDILDVDFWTWPGLVNMSVEFVVAPEKKEDLLVLAREYNVPLTVLIENIQSAFDAQIVKNYIRRHMHSFNWKSYYRTDDIYLWLGDLCMEYPEEIKIFNIGNSHEGRRILAARIILKDSNRSSKVIVEGGIHAREWVSISFVTYMLHQILTSANSTDYNLRRAAKEYEWYFVPILNPDGYEYSHDEDRLFRKNKRHVDLNRNFDYEFGKVGVSHDVMSQTYCGPYAFSEAESTAMKNFVIANQKSLKYFISFHSYGQFIIIPYGNTFEYLENYNEVKVMSDRAAKQISKRYGTTYRVGNALGSVGYMVSGTSPCWVKNTLHVPYVMTLELRDRGNDGFALPPKYIIPTCEETMDGVISLLSPQNVSKYNIYRERNCAVGYTTLWYLVYFVLYFRAVLYDIK